jgi:hypothetical protein
LSCANLKTVLISADTSAAAALVADIVFTRTESFVSSKPAMRVIAVRACLGVKSARTFNAAKAVRQQASKGTSRAVLIFPWFIEVLELATSFAN